MGKFSDKTLLERAKELYAQFKETEKQFPNAPYVSDRSLWNQAVDLAQHDLGIHPSDKKS